MPFASLEAGELQDRAAAEVPSTSAFNRHALRSAGKRMISINLLVPRGLGPARSMSDNGIMLNRDGGASQALAAPSLHELKPPSLSPALMERLLGKSPLRLIAQRTQLEKHVWKERLECGHEVHTFIDFEWDYGGHLVLFEPTALRRRCRECKALADVSQASSNAPKKPVRSVGLPKLKERQG
jgi:hypothetical protein